ncbi:MAG: MBL fold metallo-hydrolase [bacterium]|nr:MBL fold metallo-hydrolase [bacterium]
MSIKITVIPVGPLQMNSVLLTSDDPDHQDALLIDPGADPARILETLDESGCKLQAILATHGHFDHVEGAAAIQDVHDLPLQCHTDDVFLIENMNQSQTAYGLPTYPVPRFQPNLAHGDSIDFAGVKIEVSHVPGHSPGQLMFTFEGHAIVGDCIFAGSIGRTDLPGGDFPTLEKSIRERIYTLADETVIICGHGPNTTVGREKTSNPFVQG